MSEQPNQNKKICGIDKEDKICPNCGKEKGVYVLMCDDCKAKPLEQPNQNLMIIEEIEGLISQVNKKLIEGLRLTKNVELPQARSQGVIILKTLEKIDLFQKTTLFELRKAFE